jgi:hypothetical protein
VPPSCGEKWLAFRGTVFRRLSGFFDERFWVASKVFTYQKHLECCDNDEEGWAPNEEVMASYSEWCKNNNVHYPKGPKALAQSLKAKGYEPGMVKKINNKNQKRCRRALHLPSS